MHLEWIPCTEKLPCEKDGMVLISMPNGEVNIGKHSEFIDVWFKGSMMTVGGDNPVAWMPLPESYKDQPSLERLETKTIYAVIITKKNCDPYVQVYESRKDAIMQFYYCKKLGEKVVYEEATIR